MEEKRIELAEHFGSDLMFADNFDAAIIGVSVGLGSSKVVYDTKKMAEILIKEHSMTEEDAWEYLEYNTFGVYVGDNTPVYVDTSTWDDLDA